MSLSSRYCCALAAWGLIAGSVSASATKTLTAARDELHAAYGEKLEQLAVWCEQHELPDRARQARAWLPPRSADGKTLFVLSELRSPEHAGAEPEPAPEAKADEEFRSRFRALRSEHAAALWSLAKQAADAQHASAVYELATEAAREDREFAPAWRFLGYLKQKDEWRSPWEIKQLGAGLVWHKRFGWLPKGRVAAYERGQRYYRNRWISAEEESRLRKNIADGWRIETDHFRVSTDHSLEEGVRLARQLERLFAVWQQEFAGYVVNESDLPRRVAKGEPARTRNEQKHDVVYFRTREEYNAAISTGGPQVETIGLYLNRARKAYFFAGPGQEPGTVYHEAAHQLFHETRQAAADVGQANNFWIIEAVACYFETLTEHEGYVTLGGRDDGRLPGARKRLLIDQVYMPLAELVTLGMQDLQRHTDIAKLYSESAGLATFLASRYPEALVRYLESVYAGRADRDTLARLTGRDYAELDREYREFLSSL